MLGQYYAFLLFVSSWGIKETIWILIDCIFSSAYLVYQLCGYSSGDDRGYDDGDLFLVQIHCIDIVENAQALMEIFTLRKRFLYKLQAFIYDKKLVTRKKDPKNISRPEMCVQTIIETVAHNQLQNFYGVGKITRAVYANFKCK